MTTTGVRGACLGVACLSILVSACPSRTAGRPPLPPEAKLDADPGQATPPPVMRAPDAEATGKAAVDPPPADPPADGMTE